MQKIILLITILLFAATPLLASNGVDVRMLRSVNIDANPLQVVATADGQRIYVLTEKGEIQLFSANGDPLGNIDAGPGITGIAPQGANRLILQKGTELVLIGLEPVAEISTKGASSMGPADAPVTIVIYDDFECPYCAKAVPLVKEVVAAYAKQVRLVYKNFPLGMHKHARAAAVAGLAAERQGKFWQLHDLLFANYNKLNPNKINELAQQAGLDMEKFKVDQVDPQLVRQLNADLQEGQKIGVRGTPSIFVNGRRLPQRSRPAFDALIKSELAKLAPAKQ